MYFSKDWLVYFMTLHVFGSLALEQTQAKCKISLPECCEGNCGLDSTNNGFQTYGPAYQNLDNELGPNPLSTQAFQLDETCHIDAKNGDPTGPGAYSIYVFLNGDPYDYYQLYMDTQANAHNCFVAPNNTAGAPLSYITRFYYEMDGVLPPK